MCFQSGTRGKIGAILPDSASDTKYKAKTTIEFVGRQGMMRTFDRN